MMNILNVLLKMADFNLFICIITFFNLSFYSMTENYDINIDNYSDEELLKIIKINDTIENLSIDKINDQITIIISKLSNNNQVDLIDFITKAGEKIKKSINKYKYDKYSYPIINHSLPNAVSNLPTFYPQGKINPIEKRTITKVLNIDTVFRKNYNNTISTDFSWILNQPETNVVSMKVSSIDLPISWYNIDDIDNRNQFTISTYNLTNIEDKTSTITIPPGSYNDLTFIKTINNLLYTNGNTTDFFICELNPTSQNFVFRIKDETTFYQTNTPDFYFIVNFFPNKDKYSNSQQFSQFQKTFAWNIGFRNFTYETYSNTTINLLGLTYKTAFQSEAQFNLKHDNYVFLNLDDFNSNCICQPITSSTWNSFLGNSILARITVNSDYKKTLFDTYQDHVFRDRIYLGPVTLERFKIQILNKFGEIIDLNGKNFSFTLELTELY